MKDRLFKTEKASWQDIAMPFVLMAVGIVVAAGTYLGLLSLDRVQNLWPAAFLLAVIVELVPAGGLDRES